MTERTIRLAKRLREIKPSICSERAVIITEAYKENEAKPYDIIRAKALEKILKEMSINIYDDELIVGNQASRPKAAPIFPEFSSAWILNELDTLQERSADRFYVDENTKSVLRTVLPYWKGRNTQDKSIEKIPQKSMECNNELVFLLTSLSSGIGHIAIDYKKVLKLGMSGIKELAREKLDNLDLKEPQELQKKSFYEAAIIVCDATVSFARRYAKLAEEIADKENDKQRASELLKIAAICKKVPELPATNFYEALQSFWFVQLIMQIESNGHSISPGRFDQYMYEYYKKDIEEGVISKEFAEELVQCLWIKFNEVNKIRNEVSSKAFGGYPMFQNLIVGGVDKHGEDATNELSELFIKVTGEIAMPQPSLSIRYHNGTPDRFLSKACELAKKGLGTPAFFNDEVIIPMLLSSGCTVEEARDYAEVGCVEPQVQGKTEGFYTGGFLNSSKVLEITLNNGVNPITGSKLGLSTGNEFNTFEEFYDAYKAQLNHFVELQCIADNAIEFVQGEITPTPFASCFVDNCFEKGLDVRKGGAKYNNASLNCMGLANTADALAVIKKLVFEEHKLSFQDMKNVLKNNFANSEDIRQMFLNDAPKYGNGNEYVDEIARRVGEDFCDAVRKQKNARGGVYYPGLQSISAHALFVDTIGATPDGRRMEDLLSDGGVSAAQGRDKKGPTSLVRSAARLDHHKATGGSLLNIKFHPSAVEGEKGTRNMMALIKTYFEMKGQHVQFNVVSSKTLRDAQKNPEKYRDLIVRVAGFSVYFTNIDKVLQNDIIERTEQMF